MGLFEELLAASKKIPIVISEAHTTTISLRLVISFLFTFLTLNVMLS